MAQLSHYTFILIAGMNLYFSYKKNEDNKKDFYKKQISRSRKIIILWNDNDINNILAFGKQKFVKFGILHFMSTSIILSLLTVGKKYFNLILFPIMLILNIYLQKNSGYFLKFCSKNPLFCFILGIPGIYMYLFNGTLDHFSLLSKYPVFALGIGMGHLLYKKKDKENENNKEYNKITKSLIWMVKNLYLFT